MKANLYVIVIAAGRKAIYKTVWLCNRNVLYKTEPSLQFRASEVKGYRVV